MFYWRNSIAFIQSAITGKSSKNWRADVIAIAKARGLDPSGWRDALHSLATQNNVPKSGWRKELTGIARATGASAALSWREALQHMEEMYKTPQEWQPAYDAEGRILYDAAERNLYVRGRS